MLVRLRPVVLLVALALPIAGCTKSPPKSATTAQSVVPQSADVGRGKQIYAANCVQCHGASGVEGGVGPSLRGERAKKDLAATIGSIENPKPPMPKLFPGRLSEKDVADVAAYVQSL